MTNLRVLLVPALLAALTLLPAAVPPAGAKEPAKASAAAPAREADIEVLRDTIRTNKKALVAASLDLSDAEKAKFWPIYESYQKELTAVHDRYLKVIDDYTKNFATLTDEHAKQLLDEWLTADADRVEAPPRLRAEVRRGALRPEARALLPDREQDGRGRAVRSRGDDPGRAVGAR